MGTKNKSYYRNWYQHWKEEEQEKLEQSMNEVRAYQHNIESTQYKANHDLSRQYGGYTQSVHRKSQSPYSATRRKSQTSIYLIKINFQISYEVFLLGYRSSLFY